MAAQRIIVDGASAVAAGGVESISLVQNNANKHHYTSDWIKANKPEIYWPMIDTAETVAKRYNISREAQDEFGARKPARAPPPRSRPARFNDEIVPLKTTKQMSDKDGSRT